MKTVVLVEGHALTRAGLRTALEGSGDLQVVAEADDGPSGLDAIVEPRRVLPALRGYLAAGSGAYQWLPGREVTEVAPSTLRSWSAATFLGPGLGADPGAGCGKAVDMAV